MEPRLCVCVLVRCRSTLIVHGRLRALRESDPHALCHRRSQCHHSSGRRCSRCLGNGDGWSVARSGLVTTSSQNVHQDQVAVYRCRGWQPHRRRSFWRSSGRPLWMSRDLSDDVTICWSHAVPVQLLWDYSLNGNALNDWESLLID